VTQGPDPVLERTVEHAEDGERVDAVVAAWLDESRGSAQARLAGGRVLVDGAEVVKSHRVAAGQRVVVLPAPAVADAPAPPPVPVRHEDEHLLVVAKPAGLVVHAGAGTRGGTLVDALAAMGIPLASRAQPERPGIVHRLDRGTSGLLVVAKSEPAYDGLVDLFRRHEVDRAYWALVDGVPDPPRATIDAPIARSAVRRTRFAIDPSGRRAVSHYDVERAFGRCSVLTVRLETGRTHQVRVHMSSVGHPVTADTTYGASARLRDELSLSRPALHARHLGFTHPVTGTPVAVDEPLPPDLAAALEVLGAPDA
jgi:23S rRNA pseudouridine1911/1915/1917 synthase